MENKIYKCPNCDSDLKKADVKIEGSKESLVSYQCSNKKCSYYIFSDKEKISTILKELKTKEDDNFTMTVVDDKSFVRQGLQVSIDELKKLIKELEQDSVVAGKKLPTNKKLFLVPIINKTPMCSDTWELEEMKGDKNEDKI